MHGIHDNTRIIAHFDMDAFFAAVEERNNPRFAGMPIVVGADPRGGAGRGVVSTANYAARAFGIGSGMAISRAWKLARLAQNRGEPETIFLPGSWRIYSEISKHVMSIIKTHASEMQQRSVDEAYADFSDQGSIERVSRIARQIQEEIYAAEDLTVSVGVGPNKLIAKIASDYDKPNGLTVIDISNVMDFLAPLPVRAIPGIGPQTEKRLKELSITIVRDLQQWSESDLVERFGSSGRWLYRKSRGVDTSLVTEQYIRKSIGEQRTFVTDVIDVGVVIQKMDEIARDVFHSLQKEGNASARTVAITVRFHDFQTISSAHTNAQPYTDAQSVIREAIRLLLPFLDSRRNPQRKRIRLIGLRLEKLQ